MSKGDLLKSYCAIKDCHYWICCSIHTCSWWNYYVRRNPNHDCCCLTFEIGPVVHLNYFSKYDFNWQSMLYKKKVLVIGYWVRSSNNHSPNFLFFIFPLFRDNCSCFLEIFCGFGWMLTKNLKFETIFLTIRNTSKECQTRWKI